jgi:hypothetical protein
MFAGLIGIAAPSAFFSGEVAFLLFAVIGLMLVGFTDYSRRPIIIHAAAKACPVSAFGSHAHNHVRDVHPFECVKA